MPIPNNGFYEDLSVGGWFKLNFGLWDLNTWKLEMVIFGSETRLRA